MQNGWGGFFGLSGVFTCQPEFTALVLLSSLSTEAFRCSCIITKVQDLTRKRAHSEVLVAD